MRNVQIKVITIRILKHRETDLLRAVPDDAIVKRREPWDPDNPDLRGFCLHGRSEEDVVGRLVPELRHFLEHLGFVVCGDLTLVRSVESEVSHFWPSVYIATVQLSRPGSNSK